MARRTWELAVANGEYQVHLVAGDSSYTDSVYKFNVENTLVVNGTPMSSKHFIEGTAIVNVTDGRLTISNASGASNNKLTYVDIESVEDDSLPAVSLSATHASASEEWGDGCFYVHSHGRHRCGAGGHLQDRWQCDQWCGL